MATTTTPASQAWQNALKLRKELLKQLEKMKNTGASGVDISQLEAVDGILEKFRLECVQAVFLDFDFAVQVKAQEMLWVLHTSISSEYRAILTRIKSSSHAVQRRKTEKLYTNFLRIAQKFYQGFIQRLSARYDIPELKRAAKGIRVEQMTAAHLIISPVPSQLSASVLRSCHDTLLHLGDLARYTVQAKHKNSGYELALTYFALAQHILPTLGYAFHQMGIVSIAQGNHLDVVYHFYRAWAITIPHPNAKSNLETEFKSLNPPTSVKSKRASSGPQDTLIMWFVRLHALFYKGEATSQLDEVEREVVHRLEIAAGSATCRDVILKMSLINMAAQHVAALKCSEGKSAKALHFFQCVSHFNIKFLTVFASVLEFNLKESLMKPDDASEDDSETSPQVADSLLPAFRCYSMWLAASRQELFANTMATARQSLVITMTKTVSRVFTYMCTETYDKDNLLSCPYLLPEDNEIIGFEPLNEKSLPEACRSFCLASGQVKPHLDAPEQRLDTQREKLARILDILRCAYFLAEEPKVPLSCRVMENSLLFEYQPDVYEPQPQGPAQSSPLRKESAAVVPVTISVQKHRSQITIQERRTTPNTCRSKQSEVATAPALASTAQSDKAADQVGDAENTVINMLTPFLKPPTPQLQRSPKEPGAQPSDHGVRRSIAADLLGTDYHQDSSPTRSIPSGRFEPLPWVWFNTPKPTRGENSPHSVAAMSPNTPGLSSGKFDDPFSGPWTPSNPDSSTFRRASSHLHIPNSSMAANVSDGSTAEQGHRASLLQTHGFASRPPSAAAAAAAARTSPFGNWGETRGSSSRQGQHGGLSAPPDMWPAETMPQSSSTGNLSQFSHPSSLYHGTPIRRPFTLGNGQEQGYTGAAFEENFPFQQQLLPYQQHQHQQQQQQHQQQMTMQEYWQASTRTSSYDEAVFRSAYEGRR